MDPPGSDIRAHALHTRAALTLAANPTPGPGQLFSETPPAACSKCFCGQSGTCGVGSCLHRQFFCMVCILLLANSWSGLCFPRELSLWYLWPPPFYPAFSHCRSPSTSNLPLTFRVQDGISIPPLRPLGFIETFVQNPIALTHSPHAHFPSKPRLRWLLVDSLSSWLWPPLPSPNAS